MSLQGLPDFYAPIQAEVKIFYPYEGAGNFVLVPDGLEIAARADGKPDFALTLVRGENLSRPPEPHGMLEFAVLSRYQMDTALRVLRERSPGATLVPACFSSGFLRFRPLTEVDRVPEELLQPVPLASNGLGRGRYLLKLSQNNALLLRDSLKGEGGNLLGLKAIAEMEIVGVSPRLPLKVSFDPKQLLEALADLGNQNRQVPRDAIVNYFRNSLNSANLKVEGNLDAIAPSAVAEVLADRVRERFGTFCPAETAGAGPRIALLSPGDTGSGRFLWDLSEPTPAHRPLLLQLDPFAAARQLVQDKGIDEVVKQTVVPAINTGHLRVYLADNLPKQRRGVVALGVTFRAKPNIPRRPQAIVETEELNESGDTPAVVLRFSPAEKQEYTLQTYAVLQDATGMQRFNGTVKTYQRDLLILNPDDFPVDFVPVEASRSLLEMADIQGILKRPHSGSQIQDLFALTLDQPGIALAIPKGAEGATLEIEARSKEGLGTIKLDPVPANPLWLDLHSLPQYGTQQVEVICEFKNTLFAVFEFLPEGRPETDKITLFFLPDTPKQALKYLPQSPFQSRYRYRQQLEGPSSQPPPWSDYCSPSQPLNLQV
ncbi:hypothetical protein [Planktothrix sp. FACHB-1365]|uniref:hypothetical protein n=1 Tax=Planktothrix sp. FACHB-1365 TaxID=2692855 RepID=UPI0016838BF7|nr:hypothetical protein [Planktothrix sp. FACHB-1365]MBD2485527.1 hypothetical protein [Planktothrix sp. FACHB-1365]